MKWLPKLYAAVMAMLLFSLAVYWSGRLVGPVLPSLLLVCIGLAVIIRLLHRG